MNEARTRPSGMFMSFVAPPSPPFVTHQAVKRGPANAFPPGFPPFVAGPHGFPFWQQSEIQGGFSKMRSDAPTEFPSVSQLVGRFFISFARVPRFLMGSSVFLPRAPQRPYRSPVTKRQSEDVERKGSLTVQGLGETANLRTWS